MSDWELKAAARTVAEYMCNIKKGEDVLVYADTLVDDAVADSVAEAAHTAGGVVSLLCYETRERPDMEPPAPLAEAMRASDVLIELAWMYLIHTRALQSALDAGARFACLTMVTPSIMKRCIGPIDRYAKVLELGDTMTEMLEAASEMKMTTLAGTELTCNIKDRLIDHASKRIFRPGEQTYPGGQVSWYPAPETINGTLVFDGSMWPPEEIGLIGTPIELMIEEGEITAIEGGREAKLLERWFESWKNPNIYKLAHLSYGLNPGARLTGNILEDERVFGCLEVGIGAQPPALGIFEVDPAEATSGHTDATMLNPTVELDGEVIEKDGVFVHPRLVKIIEIL